MKDTPVIDSNFWDPKTESNAMPAAECGIIIGTCIPASINSNAIFFFLAVKYARGIPVMVPKTVAISADQNVTAIDSMTSFSVRVFNISEGEVPIVIDARGRIKNRSIITPKRADKDSKSGDFTLSLLRSCPKSVYICHGFFSPITIGGDIKF